MKSNQLTITTEDMGIISRNIQGLTIENISLTNFPGPQKQGYFLAHIYWSISYKFIAKPSISNIVVSYPLVTAQPTISPRSWMKRACADEALLRHEYGHYLIACWCSLQFLQTVNHEFREKFKGSNVNQYKQWCAQVFSKLMKKYCAIQRKYDQQTEHYCNEQKQAEWQTNIVRNINQYYKRSKQRSRQQKIQNIKPNSKQLKSQNKRAYSQNNGKKQKIQQVRPLAAGNQMGFRIRATNIPKLFRAD